jgi:quercetin dioxygenase-like cupin family protein
LGILVHKKGKRVDKHKHKLVKREILITQEVLVLLEGKMRVDLYNDEAQKLKSIVMGAGDSILLARGGHAIEILEDSKIVEVKQGPYAGFDDKEFF